MLGFVPESAEPISWEARVVPPELGGDEVHVWFFPLVVPEEKLEEWRRLLSPEEQARAVRFAFPYLRDRFVAAHATTRRLLGEYLGRDPATLTFEIADRGKPSLPGHPMHFNLSHTQEAGLLAVTRIAQIGVDIEQLDRKVDRHGIASRFFSQAESHELANLPDADQAEGFCNLWTRKEAWLKATGVGISEGLNKVEFNCRPGEAARLLRISGEECEAAAWQIRSFRPPGNHVGVIAVQAASLRTRYFRYAS